MQKSNILSLTLILALLFPLTFIAQPGVLDPTFGNNGKITLDFLEEADEAKDIAIQTDGKILVAGTSNLNFNIQFALVRYNEDGTLDNTFSEDGIVNVQFGSSNLSSAECLAIQPDGKILLAGTTFSGDFYQLAIVRFNIDGTLDNTFSGDGLFTSSFATNVFCGTIALDSDGSIVAAGASGLLGAANHISVFRVLSNGTLDIGFGNNGLQRVDIGSQSGALSVIVQSDGKIVAAGRTDDGVYNDFAVVRFLSNGSLDVTFDGDGKRTFSLAEFDDYATSLLQLPNGKLLLGGISNTEFALVQLNANGSNNTAFSADGIVQTDLNDSFDEIQDIALDADGNIVAVGHSAYNVYDIAVLRYLPNGTLDNLFSLDGKTTIDFFGTYDYGHALALQQDGKIVVAGSTDNNGNSDFALARLQGVCQIVSSTQNVSICSGESYSVGSNVYTQSGVYNNILTLPSGCDSSLITNLSVLSNSTFTQNVTITSGESFTVGNSNYTTEGTYQDILTSANGCDSIVTTNLTVTLGIIDAGSKSYTLKAWPIPFKNELVVEGTLLDDQIRVFDLSGKLILEIEAQMDKTIINTSEIQRGSYIVFHLSKSKVRTTKAFKLN
jgi:uncharacterized delta-60 repeat protein